MGEGKRQSMNLWSAASIGVGAMIGAGLFALLGIAVEIAGTLAIFAFLIAGIITLLSSYSMAKLAARYPSQAGPVEYLNRAFGKGILAGGFNLMMWIGYLIVTALYARAFGEYGSALFGFEEGGPWMYVLSSFIVVLFVGINLIGSSAVGNSELLIVAIKVLILLVFGILGLFTLEPGNVTSVSGFSLADLLLASGVVFMSYEGFGLVANTAEDLRNPIKNLPRAIFLAVVVVMIIYLLVSVTVIGNLSVDSIINAKEYALAAAAKPILGSLGFTIMGIAALFSTASAINATIYGPVRMLQETARAGQVHSFFTRQFLNHRSGMALLVTAVIVLLAANLLDLESIAETGSLIFLAVYSMVNIANLKLHQQTQSRRGIVRASIAGTVLSFVTLFYYLTIEENRSVLLLGIIAAVVFGYSLWQNKRTVE